MRLWIGLDKDFSKHHFSIIDGHDLIEVTDIEVSLLKLPNPDGKYPPPAVHVLGVVVIEDERDALVVTR